MAHVNAPMGLEEWDQLSDPYNYQQQAGNLERIGFHDHSPGRGVQIPAGGLAPGAVQAINISSSVGVVLTGTIVLWPTSIAPAGYLICDGTAYQIVQYEALYGIIGTIYNSSPPTGYFNVPWITMGTPTIGQLNWVIKT